MNNKENFNSEQIKFLLENAGKKMGANPEILKQQLKNGNVNDIIGSMPPDKAAKINKILSNPKAIEEIMNTPQAQELLKKLKGGK